MIKNYTEGGRACGWRHWAQSFPCLPDQVWVGKSDSACPSKGQKQDGRRTMPTTEVLYRKPNWKKSPKKISWQSWVTPGWAPQIHLAKPHHSQQLLSSPPQHPSPFLPRTLSLTLSPCGPLPPSSSRAGCPPGLPRKSTRLFFLAMVIGSEMSMGTNLFQWKPVLDFGWNL